MKISRRTTYYKIHHKKILGESFDLIFGTYVLKALLYKIKPLTINIDLIQLSTNAAKLGQILSFFLYAITEEIRNCTR